tara:strand:- start:1010 stop:1780 length:771 start_codon:yes stop_codon:yes gene_type:complete
MKILHGNFDNLAENYDRFRPGYSQTVKNIILKHVNSRDIKFADVGAGTGIWTRIVNNDERVASSMAIEPSDNMRKFGENHKDNKSIVWLEGSAEDTKLNENSRDLITMASSFHWANFDKATKEFHRVLKDDGVFCCLWNPRYINDNQILLDIEKKVSELNPNVKRVSSGKSKFVEDLTRNFNNNKYFHDLVFVEAQHKVQMSKDQYIGAWLSVNDIQHQLGDKFENFIEYIKTKIKNEKEIIASYRTRAWIVKKKN